MFGAELNAAWTAAILDRRAKRLGYRLAGIGEGVDRETSQNFRDEGNSLKGAVARAKISRPESKMTGSPYRTVFRAPSKARRSTAMNLPGNFVAAAPKSDRAAVPSGESRAAVKRTKLNFLRGVPTLRPPIPNCQETRPCPLDTACLLFRPARARSFRLRAQ